MSRLETSAPVGFRSRNEAGGVPRGTITGNIEAPGLIAMPAVSSGAARAAELAAVLGISARIAEEAAQGQRQRAALHARKGAEIHQANLGLASRDQRIDLVTITQELEERKRLVGDEDPVEWANALIDEKVAGMPADYADAYRADALPHLVNAANKQRESIKGEAVEANAQLFGHAAIQATTADDVTAAVNALRGMDPRISDVEAHAKVALPALESAARAGDVARFEAVSAALGPRFSPDQTRLKNMLTESVTRKARERSDAAKNEVYGLLDTDQPGDVVRDRVKALTKSGLIDQQDAYHFDNIVAAREEAKLRDAERIQKAVDEDAIRDAHAGAVAALGEAGTLPALDDFKFRDPSDRFTVTIDRNTAINQWVADKFADIDAKVSNPEAAFAEKVRVVSRNGVLPEVWTRFLQSGYQAASQSALTGEGENAPIPPATAAGFDLYTRLSAQAPATLDSVIKDERTKEFYELALAAGEDPQVGPDPQRQLLAARRAMSNPAYKYVGLKDPSLTRAIDDSTAADDAKNVNQVRPIIGRLALTQMAMGVSAEKAVDRAWANFKRNRVKVNGWWSYVNDASVPQSMRDDFGPVAEKVVDRYWGANKEALEAQGHDKDDLTLTADASNGFWYVAFGDTGIAAPEFGDVDLVALTTPRLVSFWQTMQQDLKAERDARIIRQASPTERNREKWARDLTRRRSGGLE